MTEAPSSDGAAGSPAGLSGLLRRHFDRAGRRWVLGLVLTVACTLSDRRLTRVRWTGSEWSYRYDGTTILSDQLLRPTTFDSDIGIFVWDYTPQPGDVVVDIGAGTGTEAVKFAAMVGPTGRVIAVEAHPATFAVLEKCGPMNGLETIVCVQVAATDAEGTVTISDDDDHPGRNTLFSDVAIEVPATTIDLLLDDCGVERVDFLKMNIEGSERLAVLGMERSAARIDRLAISCHDFLGTEWGATREDVRAWLVAHGFTVRSRTDEPRPLVRDYLYATRAGASAPD